MDITPKPPSSPARPPAQAASLQTPSTSSIESLNLRAGDIYEARVQQKVASPSQPHQEPTKTDTYTQTTPRSQTPKPSTEWLLNINGKLLKVASQAPLQIGQQLLVKLDTTNPATTTLLITNTPISATQTNPDRNTNINLLLSSLSQLLPKQLSLELGFSQLNILQKSISELLSKPQEPVLPQNVKNTAPFRSNQTSTPPLLIQKTVEQLLQNLTSSQHIVHANQNATPAESATLIRQAIASSGSFLESSLSNTRSIEDFSNQLQNLQKALKSTINAELNKSSQPLTAASGTNTPHNTTATSTAPAKQSLGFFQQLLNAKPIAASENSKNAPFTAPLQHDLKTSLLALSSFIATQQQNQSGPSQPADPFLSGLLQPELLNNPFNFPKVSADITSKANAIFNDKEFTTGQLLKLLGGMLNRIQFNQLNSLYQTQGSDNNLQSWFIELPILNVQNQANIFNLRIDKEEDNSHDNQQEDEKKALQWKLSLSFDLEHLGPIYIQVSLLPPAISSIIWADKTDTFELAQKEIAHFKERLKELGLDVGDIILQKGLPSQQATKLSQSLVDIQA